MEAMPRPYWVGNTPCIVAAMVLGCGRCARLGRHAAGWGQQICHFWGDNTDVLLYLKRRKKLSHQAKLPLGLHGKEVRQVPKHMRCEVHTSKGGRGGQRGWVRGLGRPRH